MSRVQGRVYTDEHTRTLHVWEKDDGTLELIADAGETDVTLTLTPTSARNLRLLLAAYERKHNKA